MIYNFDDLSFGIISINNYSHQKGTFSVQARPYAALSFRLFGSGDFKVGDKSLSVGQGDLLFIPDGVPYEVEYSVSESIVVHMHSCNYREAEAIRIGDSGELARPFLQLMSDWKSDRSVNAAKSTVYAILDRVGKIKNEAIETRGFPDCLKYIERNFCDPYLDISAVCNEGFISVSTLQRAFALHFGTSPMQYVIDLRMKRAVELLFEGKLCVKEVAARCGFTDEKYFSRVFRKKYGYPPSKLRDASDK